MIIFQNVSKYYKDMVGIENFSLSIKDGDFIFLIGKNGSGKSTLLRLITKQLEPSNGDITAYGLSLANMNKKNIPYYRRLLGIIDIQTSLLSHKTVYENIAIAMIVTGHSTKEINESVPKALGLVGLNSKANDYPSTLSGGETFKVHLARAVINHPKIIVADEPTAHLDYDSAWDIMCLFREINNLGITVIIATHAQEFVDLMRKRVVTLRNGKLQSDLNYGLGRVL